MPNTNALQRLQSLIRRAQDVVAPFDADSPEKKLGERIGRLGEIAQAEPAMALVSVRKSFQFIVEAAYERQFNEPAGTRPLENLTQRLAKEGQFPKRLAAYGNLVRELGNIGAHNLDERVELDDVTAAFEQLLPLLEWHVESRRAELPSAAHKPSASEVGVEQPRPSPGAPPRSRLGRRLVGAAAAVLAATAVYFSIAPKNKPATRLPDWGRDVPAGDVLRLVYDGAPPASTPENLSLRAQVLYRRERSGPWKILQDGDALTAADDYRIELESRQAGYLYLFQVDALGKLTALRPKLAGSAYAEGENPIGANEVFAFPGSGSLFLDERTGTEHLYAVLTQSRWEALEAALMKCEGNTGGAGGHKVDRPFNLAMRGVGGVLPGSTSSVDTLQDLPVKQVEQTYSVSDGNALVVEHWFRHEASSK